MPTRRQFLTAAATLAVPLFFHAAVLGKPSKKVRLGIVGVGRRGKQLLEAMPEGARVVAVCDVYKPRAEEVGAKHGAKVFTDFRRVLDKKNIDAVVIATPDHWHALPAILACQAGKDVYCEKPLALTVREGRAMVVAARKHDQVFQVGTQQRSLRPNEIACKLVREGAMGAVKRVVVSNNWSPSDERLPREDFIDGLDWEKWLGQANGDIPFNNKYIFPEEEPGWSEYRAFSGGEICGWGTHGYDMLQWAPGMDGSGPVEVEAEGWAGDAHVRWKYGNGLEVETGNAPKPGGKFYSERGQLNIDRNKFNIMPAGMKKELLRAIDVSESDESDQMRNFLMCVRSRKRPNADVEVGQRSVTVAHLANIARRVGGRLESVSAAERFANSEEANGHLDRERRKGYELPKV